MEKYYQIDGDNNMFATLREAKHHVYVAYTERERVKYLRGSNIVCVRDGEVRTVTPINIDNEGRYSFGRTCIY